MAPVRSAACTPSRGADGRPAAADRPGCAGRGVSTGGDGRLLVGFAALASVVLLLKGRRGTFAHGVLVAALLAGEWLEVAPLMSLGSPGWGWGPLVLGDALLLLAGWLQARQVAT